MQGNSPCRLTGASSPRPVLDVHRFVAIPYTPEGDRLFTSSSSVTHSQRLRKAHRPYPCHYDVLTAHRIAMSSFPRRPAALDLKLAIDHFWRHGNTIARDNSKGRAASGQHHIQLGQDKKRIHTAQRRTAFLLQAWAPKAQVKLGVRPTRFCPVSQDRATRRKADIIAANSRCLPAKGTGNVEGQIRERDWAIR